MPRNKYKCESAAGGEVILYLFAHIFAYVHVKQVVIANVVIGIFNEAAARKFGSVNPEYAIVHLRIAEALPYLFKIG
jgi:hypothetical protein